VRDQLSTRPDRGRPVLSQPAGPPIGLLVGVAAACLILGVLLTVVVMKFVR
jgi:hypothetical protein